MNKIDFMENFTIADPYIINKKSIRKVEDIYIKMKENNQLESYDEEDTRLEKQKE